MTKIESIFNKIVLIGMVILGCITCAISCITLRQTSKLVGGQLNSFTAKAFIILVGVMIIAGISYFINRRLMKSSKRTTYIVVGIVSVCILLFQILYILCVTKAYPQTDNYTVLTNTMRMAREGKLTVPNESGYFGAYTNNYFIVFFLYGFFRLMLFFNIDQLWNAAIVLNIIMIDLAIAVTFLTVKRIRGINSAAMALVLIAICPTTYQWVTFTYTNTLSLVFCMLLLYMAVIYPEKQKTHIQIIYMMVMGVIAAVGYLLRATIVIPFIAVSIYLIFKLYHGEHEKVKVAPIAIKVAAFVLCFFIVTKLITTLEKPYLADATQAKRFPITHWLMLGVSEHGGYSAEDAAFTRGYEEYDDKKEANIQQIKKRLNERNMPLLLKKKLQRVWGEGTDEAFNFNQQDTSEHKLFKYVNGNRNLIWMVYSQAYRAFTFLCIVFAAISLLKGKKREDEFLYALTLFGSMVFFILWEANVKYSISFMFVMTILMQYGIETSQQYVDGRTRSTGIKIYGIAIAVAILLLGSNSIVLLLKQPEFTQKKEYFENATLNGKRINEVKFKGGAIEDRILVQTFETENSFNKITIMAQKQKAADKDVCYTIKLRDSKDRVLLNKEFTQSDVTKKNMIKFSCNVKKKEKAEKYRLEIQKKSGEKDSLVFGQMHAEEFDYISSGVLTVGGVESKNDLYLSIKDCVRETYTSKKMYTVVAISIIILQMCICMVLAARLKVLLKQCKK